VSAHNISLTNDIFDSDDDFDASQGENNPEHNFSEITAQHMNAGDRKLRTNTQVYVRKEPAKGLDRQKVAVILCDDVSSQISLREHRVRASDVFHNRLRKGNSNNHDLLSATFTSRK